MNAWFDSLYRAISARFGSRAFSRTRGADIGKSVDCAVPCATGKRAARAHVSLDRHRYIARQLLRRIERAEIVRNAVEATAIDDSHAAFARPRIETRNDFVHERRLARDIDVIRAALD